MCAILIPIYLTIDNYLNVYLISLQPTTLRSFLLLLLSMPKPRLRLKPTPPSCTPVTTVATMVVTLTV